MAAMAGTELMVMHLRFMAKKVVMEVLEGMALNHVIIFYQIVR